MSVEDLGKKLWVVMTGPDEADPDNFEILDMFERWQDALACANEHRDSHGRTDNVVEIHARRWYRVEQRRMRRGKRR